MKRESAGDDDFVKDETNRKTVKREREMVTEPTSPGCGLGRVPSWFARDITDQLVCSLNKLEKHTVEATSKMQVKLERSPARVNTEQTVENSTVEATSKMQVKREHERSPARVKAEPAEPEPTVNLMKDLTPFIMVGGKQIVGSWTSKETASGMAVALIDGREREVPGLTRFEVSHGMVIGAQMDPSLAEGKKKIKNKKRNESPLRRPAPQARRAHRLRSHLARQAPPLGTQPQTKQHQSVCAGVAASFLMSTKRRFPSIRPHSLFGHFNTSSGRGHPAQPSRRAELSTTRWARRRGTSGASRRLQPDVKLAFKAGQW